MVFKCSHNTESVIAVNDDTSFPDITVRVKTDLMSLTQHYDSSEQPGAFILCHEIMIVVVRSQATDVAAEIKRKLEKKEKKRKKREKKLQELEPNGEANGEAQVSLDF